MLFRSVRNKASLTFFERKRFLLEASSFRLCQMACVFKPRINPQVHRPGNLKRVAGFNNQTELYPYKYRSKSPTSSTFKFDRLSNSNVKVHTISLGL